MPTVARWRMPRWTGGKEHECSGHRGHADLPLLFQKAALAATDWEKEAPVLPNLKFQNVDF